MRKNFKKSIFVICACALLVCSCEKVSNDVNSEVMCGLNLDEVELNGHYYVIAAKHYCSGGVAILHSPNCKCK